MSKRKMTDDEITLAKSVFGDSIDYSRVRIYDRRVLPLVIQAKNRAMAFENKISYPGMDYSADFSKEDKIAQSLFIHELVHIWQHQRKIMNTKKEFAKEMLRYKFNYSAAYAHKLEMGKDLAAYRMEHQACIVQDYFLLSRTGIDKPHRNARQNGSDENLFALYHSVLKNFMDNPAYLGRDPKPRKQRRPKAQT